jgi:diaminobutyrate-2-oxoglutarate transaminase
MPGEHNGTFRGNNHAFVTSRAAIEHFWVTPEFALGVRELGELLQSRLEEMAASYGFIRKGRGMMQGLDVGGGELAQSITSNAFKRGILIETSGGFDEVVKILSPLTISKNDFAMGLDILEESIADALADDPLRVAAE